MPPFLLDPDREVREDIAVALRDLHRPEADETLAKRVDNGDVSIRKIAVQACGRLKNGRGVELASRALKDTNPGVRMAAADALGETSDPDAAEPLKSALNDTHWGVRAHAAAALQKLNKKSPS